MPVKSKSRSNVVAGRPGRSSPLGAHFVDGGVNFSLFSRTAKQVELLLFDQEDTAPARAIRLDPVRNRTYHYWHVFLPKIKSGQLYGYRVDGPREPDRGLRFDAEKVLLDPYGRGVVVPPNYDRNAALAPGDNAAAAMKSRWRRWIDTSLVSPDDIVLWDEALELPSGENSYHVGARSVVMLFAHGTMA